MQNDDALHEIAQRLRTHVIILGGFVAVIWLLELFDQATRIALDHYGIIPRDIAGLRGVLIAPFLHASFGHVAANTLPFIILGWFVLLHGTRAFLVVTVTAMIVGGIGTWLIAPSASIHIGASGLIFGYLGYLLARGYFERSWQSILLSVGVLIFYGGMLFGLLPSSLLVSWQMHVFGFVGGVLAAYLLSKSEDEEETTIEIDI